MDVRYLARKPLRPLGLGVMYSFQVSFNCRAGLCSPTVGEQVHAISLKVKDVAGKKIEQKIVRPLLKKHLNSEAAAASNSYMWAAWLCLIVLGVLVFAAMAYSLVYLLWPLEVYVCADWGHFFDPLMCTPHIESNPRARRE